MAETNKGLSGFLRKHNHLLTFAGALIVFVTFVVKEGLGERWKRIAEAIDSAQYTYSIRAEMKEHASKASEQIESLTRLEEWNTGRGKKVRTDRDKRVSDYLETIRMRDSITRVSAVVADFKLIADKLPGTNYSEQAKLFENTLEDATKEAEYFAQRYSYEYVNERTIGAPPQWKYVSKVEPKRFHTELIDKSDPNGLFQRGSQFFDSIDDFDFDIGMLTRELLKDAETVRSKNETRSQWAWWLTALLFAFGWGLGLIGKIYGISEVPSTGD